MVGYLLMVYTLTEAAKAAGRTRQAIQAAIRKGTVSARKDAFGQWEIDPAELHRVYPSHKQKAANDSGNLGLVDTEKEAQIRELRARLEALEELKREIQDRNEQLQRERDDWKQQADEWRMQAKALPAPEASSTPHKKGLWWWPPSWFMVA